VTEPRLLKVPKRVHSREELLGTISKLEGVENLVALIEDEAGVWLMVVDGTTYERINWLLDRAKLLLHRGD
jgi:beta-phosphoglucomutase-like phosphatase (HAD superfamily)